MTMKDIHRRLLKHSLEDSVKICMETEEKFDVSIDSPERFAPLLFQARLTQRYHAHAESKQMDFPEPDGDRVI